MLNQHQKITSDHLRRDAYLYVRQSTPQQLVENVESTKRQYALCDRAVALGWPRDRVHTIDTDLGLSGSSCVDREGFRKLVAEVGLGKVGIVLGLEVSRLARNSTDWSRLVELCAMSRTLILDEDGIYDPSYFNDRLLLGLKGTMSEAELHMIKERLRGGLLNKAKRAELEIPLPTGFVYTLDGKVILDPDAQVQQSFKEFFATFRRTGSATATVKFFKQQGLQFPKRIRVGASRGELVWTRLEHSQALRILHNPKYAGVYAFGKTRSHRTADGRLKITRRPQSEWDVFIEQAHGSYISLADYEENLKRLRSNSQALGIDRRAAPREGPALLQGLALCGRCGRRMTLRYHVRNGRKIPDYLCQRDKIELGESCCQMMRGDTIDDTIGKLLVEIVTPLAMEVALTVQDEFQSRLDQVDRLRKRDIERAQYEADLAKRRYMQVDPENRLVADSLEAEWNSKLRSLTEAHANYESQKEKDSKKIGEQEKSEVMALPRDFKKLWANVNTMDRERKRIVQLLIEDVTLLRHEQLADVKIRFKGGRTHELTVPLHPQGWGLPRINPEVVTRIDQLAETYTDKEIAKLLNAEGLKTAVSTSFRSHVVRRIRATRQLKSRYERLREKGLLTQQQIAEKYNIHLSTIRVWKDKRLINIRAYDDRNRFLIEDPGEAPPELIKGIWCRSRKLGSILHQNT